MKQLVLLISLASFLLTGCTGEQAVRKALNENPELVFEAIKKDPKGFMDAVNEAAQMAQKRTREDQEREEKESLEKEFSQPKKPELASDRIYMGDKAAPITIVEYSDFQCPYCSKAYFTMKKLMDGKYKGQVRLLYKHLPFKSMAEPAARYYEAIGMQSPQKAIKFHDYIYENQGGLKKGDTFLAEAVRYAGADLKKIKKDMNSERVNKILESDFAEAKKFGLSGTPGFIVNGVTVRGAYPEEHFAMIIDRHLSKN